MSAPREKILFILTSHSEFGNTGKKTGYYLPEVAHPYYALADHYDIVFATPKGGLSPLDQGSVEAFKEDSLSQRFLKDAEVQRKVENTHKVDEFLGKEHEFKAVVYPGGHGPVWDLYNNKASLEIGAKVYEQGGVVGAVCHGPVAIFNIKLSNGEHLIKGKKVTGFSNDEETAFGADKVVPYLLEDKLKENGGIYSKAAENWGSHVVVDGRLVTGQNPNSASGLGEEIRKLLAAH